LRKDLAEALYELNPGVFRFPGGCIIEGNTLETRYQWKNSVGPVENRPLNENRWNYTFKHRFFPDYYQTYGLGFYEYFLLSEDLGAEPLPVISCGLACQYESTECVHVDDLEPYIEDAVDLIEFANGPVDSEWGKVRAEMGHPEPFDLKYLAIGNEQWGEGYVERLIPFMEVLREKHPEIKIIGTAGPTPDGENFDYLWPKMTELLPQSGMVFGKRRTLRQLRPQRTKSFCRRICVAPQNARQQPACSHLGSCFYDRFGTQC
jgi:alpha-L-arabinofuranosidase